MTTRPATPIELFYSYERKDEGLCNELEKHLSPLKHQGYISEWHSGKVVAGNEPTREVDEHLNSAHIILLLVSPDFMASDYCNDVIVKRAMERHDAGEALVIPIILRRVEWQNAPFGKLQALPDNGKPVNSWSNIDEALFEVSSGIHRVIDEYLGKNVALLKNKQAFNESAHEKEDELQTLESSNNDFIQNLLKNFTGRLQELAEIRQQIAEIQSTGGYIMIIGGAGQGKSSLIARLVEGYGPQNVAHHFILFNPEPDYQITLLKHLMAHLIRKYRFSHLYIATESLPALRDYFSIILRKIVEQGGREMIFIDGLEQLEEEQVEFQDISFLPNNPPPGIVFVLGSENTLKFIEIPKPHSKYHLPKLNTSDFVSILDHHHIQLEREQVDQLYHATQGNPLYLDLTVEELKTQGIATIEEIIVRLTNHRENLFSLTMGHLEQPPKEWSEVLKPMLGVFMAAREPLSIQSIREILDIGEDRLQKGLMRLGRLVVKNLQNRFSLFHVEIYKYLHQDKRFSAQDWHKKFVQWGEKDSLSTIWDDSNDFIEQQRRAYTRQHYIIHLYYAREQRSLFQVLDEKHYGQGKIRYLDPSTRSYARDLDLGRQATVWKGRTQEEQITRLPHLWRYTLLRCSLTNHERQYPAEAFRLLVLLKHEREALQLAELLTDPILKAKTLLAIANQVQELPEHSSAHLKILTRAYTVVDAIEDNMYQRSAILLELGQILTQAQEWEQAKSVWDARSAWDKVEQAIDPIQDNEQKDSILQELGRTMAQAELWEKARRVIEMIQDYKQQAEALLDLGRALAHKQYSERAYNVWDKARQVISSIQDSKQQTEALRELGRALAQAQLWERAETVWVKAKQVKETSQHMIQRVMVLSELGRALTQAHQWERAEAVWAEAERAVKTLQNLEQAEQYIEGLLELGKALTQTFWMKKSEIIDPIQDGERHIESLAQQQKTQVYVQGEVVQAVEEKIEQEKARSKEIWTLTEQVISIIQDNKQFNEVSLELGNILIHAQRWRRAHRVIANIKDNGQKAEALLKLGHALTREQLQTQAKDILAEVRQLVDIIQNSEQRDTIVSDLARALAQAQEWDKARQVISTIQDEEQRNIAVNDLARALVQAHFWKDAEQVIKTIQDNEQQAKMLYELAGNLMHIQEWEEAERVIDAIQDSKQQTEALRELGRALAQAQLWERAETVWVKAKQVKGTSQHMIQRVMVLSELGRALTQAHQWERAEAVWAEAERVVKTLQAPEQYDALFELSKALAQAQRWEQAKLMIYILPVEQPTEALLELCRTLIHAHQWDKVQSIIDDLEENKQYAEAVLELVRALVEAKRWNDAQWRVKTIEEHKEQYAEAVRALWKALIQEQLWDKAKQVIEDIQDNEHYAEALCLLGEGLAKAGQSEQAQAILTKLERTMNMIQDSEQRDEVLSILGRALSQAQEWVKAKQVIDTIQDEELKANALGELVGTLIQAQEWEKADRLINDILDIERKFEALRVLGQALTEAEHWDLAQIIWEKVEGIIRTINNVDRRDLAAQETAYILAQAQRWDKAERIAGIIQDREQWIETLIELVRSLAQAQLWERAKQLINTIQDDECQTRALFALEDVLAKVKEWEQVRPLLEETEELVQTIQDPGKQIWDLSKLEPTIIQAQQWEQAEHLIGRIQDDRQRNTSLSELVRALAQAQQWEEAERLIGRIQDDRQRNTALNELGTTLMAAKRYEELLHFIQRAWLYLKTREDAIALLPLATGFIPIQPAIGTTFCNAFNWVDDFLVS